MDQLNRNFLVLICLTVFLIVAIESKNISDLKLNIFSIPPNPNLGDEVILTARLNIIRNSTLSNELNKAIYLWYYKMFSMDEFSLIGVGKTIGLTADGYFNGIYQVMLLSESGDFLISTKKNFSLSGNQMDLEISVNNNNYLSDISQIKYEINQNKFDFICRIFGSPTYLLTIKPENTQCDDQVVENNDYFIDFIHKGCSVSTSSKFGCLVSNSKFEIHKTFDVKINLQQKHSTFSTNQLSNVSTVIVFCIIFYIAFY